MIGTSGAYRVLHEGEPSPREGLFCYFARRGPRGRGRRRLGRRQPLRVARADAAARDGREPARARRPRPDVPAAARAASEARAGTRAATGAIAGLTFEADAGRPAGRPRSRASPTAWPRSPSALPEVREVVATGHALLASRVVDAALRRRARRGRSPRQRSRRARRAAPPSTCWNGSEPSPTPAPLGETYEPRSGAHARSTPPRASGSASSTGGSF